MTNGNITQKSDFNPEIFKAYDIRGIYGRDFDEDFAFKLGIALVRYINKKKFLVGHDDREFSPRLAKAVANGMVSAGSDVNYIGRATTPLFNFALKLFGVNGGMMVTASHIPPEYGGFKVFGESSKIIHSGSGLEQLRNMLDGVPETSKYCGQTNEPDKKELLNKYADFIFQKAKVGADELSGLAVKINIPPIGKSELDLVLKKTKIACVDSHYDIAFSFDADTDRINVFDDSNTPIHSDYAVALLVEDLVRFWRKPRVVYDLRFSRGVLEKFKERNIPHFHSRVGWSFLKENAIRHKADIAGELSGHILWKETNYSELPLLTMLRILKIMKKTGKNIAELIKPFKTWSNSGEINVATNNLRLAASAIIQKLKEKYKDGKIDESDGLTVEYDDPANDVASWWFNLRSSNTETVLRLVVEAKNKNLLDEKVSELSTFCLDF